jgi:hypothetical protein
VSQMLFIQSHGAGFSTRLYHQIKANIVGCTEQIKTAKRGF